MASVSIDLSKLPKIMNPHFYPLVFDNHPVEVLVGGANSSKSRSIAQKIIYKMIAEKPHRYLITRKVKKDVTHSCYDLLKYVIKNDFGMDNLFYYNESEKLIRCIINNNDAIAVGLDDVDKLKSFFDPTDYWIEEADQVTPKDFAQLDLRIRGKSKYTHQGILTLNPIWAGHWIKKQLWDIKNPRVICHHSTYKHNIFLDADTKEKLESITDPYYKSVYVDGNWGVYGNVVFTNYIIEDFNYGEDDLENVVQGIDYGFVHNSALIRAGQKDDDIYVFDELAGKGWLNSDFIEKAEEYFGSNAKNWYIPADSAEPDRIEEWNRAGWYRVEAVEKPKGSLKYGIDFLCSKRIHIHKSKCPILAQEIQQFKRKEDRNGEATEDFVELNDDSTAALRYATKSWCPGDCSGYQPSNYTLSDFGL